MLSSTSLLSYHSQKICFSAGGGGEWGGTIQHYVVHPPTHPWYDDLRRMKAVTQQRKSKAQNRSYVTPVSPLA